MDYTFSFQETSAAAAAIKSLQIQIKDLRTQNQNLLSELHNSALSYSSEKEKLEKQNDQMKSEFFEKESSMKEDIIYLCSRVKILEQENQVLLNENHVYKEQAIETKQNQRMVILLQDEVEMLSRKLSQKESEINLLNKRLNQLENSDIKSSRLSEGFTLSRETKSQSIEKSTENRNEELDMELAQQKNMYRDYMKNPNPSSSEWKQKVEELKKAIEGNSQELLRLKKDQYENLKLNLEAQ
ncbi:hypothetical protein SteCoe_21632 [Stentor coeruleus]|uniref:Uncharacterized protein n=1 Tax=Stentor coeruleus TaxID=5963 RepID=A0A1R2BP61_9CILI|nr:hypothetical protein SteCoe_21632 [Stentor coeruleus]